MASPLDWREFAKTGLELGIGKGAGRADAYLGLLTVRPKLKLYNRF
jgi:hypothetical protein